MGKILYANEDGSGQQEITYDDELSFKDFTNWDFKSRPEYVFDNKVIYGSCFSQEEPDSDIFGKVLVNTTFVKCNLDNVRFL